MKDALENLVNELKEERVSREALKVAFDELFNIRQQGPSIQKSNNTEAQELSPEQEQE